MLFSVIVRLWSLDDNIDQSIFGFHMLVVSIGLCFKKAEYMRSFILALSIL